MRLLLIIAALLLATACGEDPKANINVGSIAPTFQTFSADGGVTRFPAAYFGKPLVIRFWADWCKYCEGEIKAIESVYQRHQGKGLQVLAIDAGQDKATINAFIKKIGVSLPGPPRRDNRPLPAATAWLACRPRSLSTARASSAPRLSARPMRRLSSAMHWKCCNERQQGL